MTTSNYELTEQDKVIKAQRGLLSLAEFKAKYELCDPEIKTGVELDLIGLVELRDGVTYPLTKYALVEGVKGLLCCRAKHAIPIDDKANTDTENALELSNAPIFRANDGTRYVLTLTPSDLKRITSNTSLVKTGKDGAATYLGVTISSFTTLRDLYNLSYTQQRSRESGHTYYLYPLSDLKALRPHVNWLYRLEYYLVELFGSVVVKELKKVPLPNSTPTLQKQWLKEAITCLVDLHLQATREATSTQSHSQPEWRTLETLKTVKDSQNLLLLLLGGAAGGVSPTPYITKAQNDSEDSGNEMLLSLPLLPNHNYNYNHNHLATDTDTSQISSWIWEITAKLLLERELPAFVVEGLVRQYPNTDYLALVLSHRDRALFLLLAERWEEYAQFDFDYRYLTHAYQGGDKHLKQRITNKIRKSGISGLNTILTSQSQVVTYHNDNTNPAAWVTQGLLIPASVQQREAKRLLSSLEAQINTNANTNTSANEQVAWRELWRAITTALPLNVGMEAFSRLLLLDHPNQYQGQTEAEQALFASLKNGCICNGLNHPDNDRTDANKNIISEADIAKLKQDLPYIGIGVYTGKRPSDTASFINNHQPQFVTPDLALATTIGGSAKAKSELAFIKKLATKLTPNTNTNDDNNDASDTHTAFAELPYLLAFISQSTTAGLSIWNITQNKLHKRFKGFNHAIHQLKTLNDHQTLVWAEKTAKANQSCAIYGWRDDLTAPFKIGNTSRSITLLVPISSIPTQNDNSNISGGNADREPQHHYILVATKGGTHLTLWDTTGQAHSQSQDQTQVQGQIISQLDLELANPMRRTTTDNTTGEYVLKNHPGSEEVKDIVIAPGGKWGWVVFNHHLTPFAILSSSDSSTSNATNNAIADGMHNTSNSEKPSLELRWVGRLELEPTKNGSGGSTARLTATPSNQLPILLTLNGGGSALQPNQLCVAPDGWGCHLIVTRGNKGRLSLLNTGRKVSTTDYRQCLYWTSELIKNTPLPVHFPTANAKTGKALAAPSTNKIIKLLELGSSSGGLEPRYPMVLVVYENGTLELLEWLRDQTPNTSHSGDIGDVVGRLAKANKEGQDMEAATEQLQARVKSNLNLLEFYSQPPPSLPPEPPTHSYHSYPSVVASLSTVSAASSSYNLGQVEEEDDEIVRVVDPGRLTQAEYAEGKQATITALISLFHKLELQEKVRQAHALAEVERDTWLIRTEALTTSTNHTTTLTANFNDGYGYDGLQAPEGEDSDPKTLTLNENRDGDEIVGFRRLSHLNLLPPLPSQTNPNPNQITGEAANQVEASSIGVANPPTPATLDLWQALVLQELTTIASPKANNDGKAATATTRVTCATLSPDKKFIAVGMSNGELNLYSLETDWLDLSYLLDRSPNDATTSHLNSLRNLKTNLNLNLNLNLSLTGSVQQEWSAGAANVPTKLQRALDWLTLLTEYRFRHEIELEAANPDTPVKEFDIELD